MYKNCSYLKARNQKKSILMLLVRNVADASLVGWEVLWARLLTIGRAVLMWTHTFRSHHHEINADKLACGPSHPCFWLCFSSFFLFPFPFFCLLFFLFIIISGWHHLRIRTKSRMHVAFYCIAQRPLGCCAAAFKPTFFVFLFPFTCFFLFLLLLCSHLLFTWFFGCSH